MTPSAEGPATVTLTAKWRDASEAARKSQHHFPADCLAEAALVVEALTADLAAAEQARDDWHITARTMLEQRDDAEQVIANVRALHERPTVLLNHSDLTLAYEDTRHAVLAAPTREASEGALTADLAAARAAVRWAYGFDLAHLVDAHRHALLSAAPTEGNES